MAGQYTFPHAVSCALGFPQQYYLEAMRGPKGWLAVLCAVAGHSQVQVGRGLSLDSALDDLAAGMDPAPPQLTSSHTTLPVAVVRKLETFFTAEAMALKLTRPTLGEFHAELAGGAAAAPRLASGHSAALALAGLVDDTR